MNGTRARWMLAGRVPRPRHAQHMSSIRVCILIQSWTKWPSAYARPTVAKCNSAHLQVLFRQLGSSAATADSDASHVKTTDECRRLFISGLSLPIQREQKRVVSHCYFFSSSCENYLNVTKPTGCKRMRRRKLEVKCANVSVFLADGRRRMIRKGGAS